MLSKLTLTNFRKHRDSAFTFTSGMNVIRGQNEASKSTIFEAIAYALFGVKVLRNSIDETVTWGQSVNTLKVELEFAVEGTTYTLKRSKASCELNADGLVVTGQTEVTSYVAKLLKMDAQAAARLSMSSQSEIRGALEAGTKATTELIEKLAEFDQIDTLIELMQEKLTLGSTANALAALDAAQQALVRARTLATAPDEAALKRSVKDAEQVLAEKTQELAKATQEEEKALEEHSEVRERIIHRDSVPRAAEAAASAAAATKDRLEKLVKPKVPGDAQTLAQSLQGQIAAAKDLDRVLALRDSFNSSYKPWKGATRPESLDDLELKLRALENERVGINSDIVSARSSILLLEERMLRGTCSFCGKDFSGVPEVDQKNAELRAQIAEQQSSMESLSQRLQEVNEALSEVSTVVHETRAVQRIADKIGPDLVEVDSSVLPPKLKWIGANPTEAGRSVKELEAELAGLRNAQDAASKWEAQSTLLKEQLAEQVKTSKKLSEELAALPVESTTLYKERLDVCRAQTAAMRKDCENLRTLAADAQRMLKDEVKAYERALAQVKELEATVQAKQEELAELEFNNGLLKRVRQCRPAIADKLWTIVLQAVSTYFSEIRGTRSRVSKDSSGFKVDDHSVSSMSGSTLDALGLAIRVALVRTFLPSAPFILLDEPFAAMDPQRTDNTLGFLASTGFSQTLLITHEEVSQDIANHIINIGD